jgi:hypothetical protein
LNALTSARALAVFAVMALSATCSVALADPVDVVYTVSGTRGNWTLDFMIANHMDGSTEEIYFFGVALDSATVSGSPDFFTGTDQLWSNLFFGGSDTVYNHTWFDDTYFEDTGINVDGAAAGFLLTSTAASVPTSLPWFAYGIGQGTDYMGTGNFNGSHNPGFEGIAPAIAMPEPESVLLTLAGLALCGVASMRRRDRR